jgi:hypothetical protein
MQRILMRSSIASSVLLVLVFSGIARTVNAAVITMPPGLNPGDPYRLVFVTSTGDLATSTDIAHYNAFVTTVANTNPDLAALGATWSAIGSTAAVDAIANIGTTTSPIYLLDGTLFATSTADMFDSSVLAPLLITESGAPLPSAPPYYYHVWTGTSVHGTADAHPLGTPTPRSAWAGHTTGTWISYQNSGAGSALFSMFAISSELTVSAVPEPATASLLFLGIAAILAARRLRTNSEMGVH